MKNKATNRVILSAAKDLLFSCLLTPASCLLLLGLLTPAPARAQAPGFDTYGGSLLESCPNTTGHFTLEKVGNRWWFCTPAGHVFFANAVGNLVTNVENDCNGKSNAPSYVAKYASCGKIGQPACVGSSDPGTTYNWGWHTEKLMQLWGFNAIGQDYGGYVSPLVTCNWGPYSSASNFCNWPPVGGTNNPNPLRMPALYESKPAEYAMIQQPVNNAVILREPVKDMENGLNDVWTGLTSGGANLGGGYRGSALIDVFDAKIGTWWSNYLANSTDPGATAVRASSPWILGVFTDDSDYLWGSGAGPDFYVNSGENNSNQIGWSVMIASPLQTMFKQSTLESAGPFLYSHTIVDSKADTLNPSSCSIASPCSLRDYLKNKYGSVGALNTAWAWSGCSTAGTGGSNACPAYTTFDSSCTMVGTVGDFASCSSSAPAETVGTGDGSTPSFSHLLAHAPLSPNSVLIGYGGQPSMGDGPWYAYNNGFNAVPVKKYGGTNWGEIVTPAYYGATASESGTTMTVTLSNTDVPVFPTTLYVGETVTLSLCSAGLANGTWTVSGVSPSTDQFTFNVGATGIASSTGCKVLPWALYPPAFSYSQTTATASGGIVTMTTGGALPTAANGSTVKITGCNAGSYNGTFTVTGTTSSTFTYADAAASGNTTGCSTNFYAQVSENGTTVTVALPQMPPGLSTASYVSLYNCQQNNGNNVSGYQGVWPVASVGSSSFTFSDSDGSLPAGYCSLMGTSLVNYSTGALTLDFLKAPASGAAIAGNYVYNGWMSGGTGLMDEDGTGAMTWQNNLTVGTNGYCVEGPDPNYPAYFSCQAPYTGQYHPAPNACNGLTVTRGSCQFATDVDAWIAHYTAKFAQTTSSGLAAVSSLPYLGLDDVGSAGDPPFSTFLQGLAPYVNGLFTAMPYTWAPSPGPAAPAAAYQYLTQYAGDVPFLIFSFPNANPDSSCYCNNSTFGVSRFPTQPARGQAWYSTVNWLLTTLGYNNDYQFVGSSFWNWQDFDNINQGLVTIDENPYDGQAAATAAGLDAFGVPTGGESFNYGNVITPLEQANALWLQVLAGQIKDVSGAATITGAAH